MRVYTLGQGILLEDLRDIANGDCVAVNAARGEYHVEGTCRKAVEEIERLLDQVTTLRMELAEYREAF